MHYYSSIDFAAMQNTFRVNFINSLSGFKSCNLIGTVDKQGNTNLAVFSSVVHLGADPALIGMVARPRSVERHTIENIIDTGFYSINHVSTEILQRAHQTSARHPKGSSEFDAVGLTPEYFKGFEAPLVHESKLSLLVKLVEVKHLDVNDTEFIIGEIQGVLLKQDAVHSDGYVDVESLRTVSATGLDSYHKTERIGRLSYAKPGKPLNWL